MNFRTSAIVLVLLGVATPAMAAIDSARVPDQSPKNPNLQACLNQAAQSHSDQVRLIDESIMKDSEKVVQRKNARSKLKVDRLQCQKEHGQGSPMQNPEYKKCVSAAIAEHAKNSKIMSSDEAHSIVMSALQACDDRFLLKTGFEGSGGLGDRIGRRCPEDPRKDPGCTITSLPDLAYVNVPTIEQWRGSPGEEASGRSTSSNH